MQIEKERERAILVTAFYAVQAATLHKLSYGVPRGAPI